MGKTILEIKNLTKYYGEVRGVKNLSLKLEEGEIFGFIGPNGAGKSTTICSIMNLINKTEGENLINKKEINKDDSVSYGRTYIADSNRKIASISIGYADGFPRCLSNKNMLVKVNGNYSKVIGRICMDQCVIDVTDVKEIKTGDVVYIIDCDDINLSSEKFAMNADTITNEFLSRLGNRLPRIRS